MLIIFTKPLPTCFKSMFQTINLFLNFNEHHDDSLSSEFQKT